MNSSGAAEAAEGGGSASVYTSERPRASESARAVALYRSVGGAACRVRTVRPSASVFRPVSEG